MDVLVKLGGGGVVPLHSEPLKDASSPRPNMYMASKVK